jgi:hypothetical protein
MSYAERDYAAISSEAKLIAVEQMLNMLWDEDYLVSASWRVKPLSVTGDNKSIPAGIVVFCDYNAINQVGLATSYSWLIVMHALATTKYSHFLMDMNIHHLDSGAEVPAVVPAVLTEDELEELDDQIRVKNALEEGLREFSAGGWFSIAIKQSPNPTLLVCYDEEHSKRQGYNQRRMRTFIREMLNEIDIVHDFSGVNFYGTSPDRAVASDLIIEENLITQLSLGEADAIR